jgi:hypothetical protein
VEKLPYVTVVLELKLKLKSPTEVVVQCNAPLELELVMATFDIVIINADGALDAINNVAAIASCLNFISF